MKTNVSHSNGRLAICALLLTLAVSILPVTSALAGTGGRSGRTVNEEGVLVISDPVASVTIEKKVLEAVITNVGDRYRVSDETIITNTEGRQVSIREMLVPCDAEITYKTEKGKRVAQRIKTTRLGSDNTWKWSADRPE
jgi:hypothetical protein